MTGILFVVFNVVLEGIFKKCVLSAVETRDFDHDHISSIFRSGVRVDDSPLILRACSITDS